VKTGDQECFRLSWQWMVSTR